MIRFFTIITIGLASVLAQAQVRHIGEVELLEYDEKTATFQAEGIADKKGETGTAAKELIFEKLFYEGIEGVNDGEKLINNITPRNKFYLDKFFEGKNASMNRFVAGEELLGSIVKNREGKFSGSYTIVVKYKLLLRDLELNKLLVKQAEAPAVNPQEQVSKEEVFISSNAVGSYRIGSPLSGVPESMLPLYTSIRKSADTFMRIECIKNNTGVLLFLGDDENSGAKAYETSMYFILISPEAKTEKGLHVGSSCSEIQSVGGVVKKHDSPSGSAPMYYMELDGLYFFFKGDQVINGRINNNAPCVMISNCIYPFFA